MVHDDKLRVLLADDHSMILEMFEMFADSVADIEVATVADLESALARIESDGAFDIVLLDLNMPGMNGLAGLDKARDANQGKPVAIITGSPTAHLVDEVIARGGAGVLPKTTSLRSVGNAIRFMAAGERYVPLDLMNDRNAARAALAVPLTDREIKVLEALAEGMSNRDIGAALGLAEPTVKMHVQSICKKLGASNRTQAVIVSRDMNVL